MDSDKKKEISELYTNRPEITLATASQICKVFPLEIYRHLRRINHKNCPYLSPRDVEILQAKTENPYMSHIEIAQVVGSGCKKNDVAFVLSKHGYAAQLVPTDPKIVRLHETIKKVLESDPLFPPKDLHLYVGDEYCPRDIREAYITVKNVLRSRPKKAPLVNQNIANTARRKGIVQYMAMHPAATYADLAKVFKVSKNTISADMREISTAMRIQQAEAYELHRHRINLEIQAVKKNAIDTFKDSKARNKAGLLDVYLNAIEKETKLYGLNAPDRKQVQVETAIQSKEERDAVVDAYFTVSENDERIGLASYSPDAITDGVVDEDIADDEFGEE